MKKIFIPLLIFIITLSGCSLPFLGEESQPSFSSINSTPFQTEPLSVNDVTNAFQAVGLPLVDNHTLIPADFLIDDITPVIYNLKQSDQFLLLYDYKSIANRIDAEWTGNYYYGFGAKDIPNTESWFSHSVYTKNFVIFYMVDIENIQPNYSAYIQVLKSIKRALSILNNTQKMIFADKSRHFDAICTIEYYQHWYINDRGQIGADQHSHTKWQVKYLGSNPEAFAGESYAYRHPGGGSSCIGDVFLKKIGRDYYLNIYDADRSHIPYRDSDYTLTIKWNGQQETLHLQAVPQYFQIPATSPFEASFLKYPALRKYMTPPYSSY